MFLGVFGNDTVTDYNADEDQLLFNLLNVETTVGTDDITGFVVITVTDGTIELGTVTLDGITDATSVEVGHVTDLVL